MKSDGERAVRRLRPRPSSAQESVTHTPLVYKNAGFGVRASSKGDATQVRSRMRGKGALSSGRRAARRSHMY